MEQHLRRIATSRELAPHRGGLDIHKKEILKLAGSAESPQDCGTSSYQTLSNSASQYNLKRSERMESQIPGKELPFKGETRKLNLDPFKDQVQK
jgi:hypothetical protein